MKEEFRDYNFPNDRLVDPSYGNNIVKETTRSYNHIGLSIKILAEVIYDSAKYIVDNKNKDS